MAASLKEFGDPVGNRQLVLTLLRGLNGMFRHMVSNLRMQRPFPTFTEARTLLLLGEIDVNDLQDDGLSEPKIGTQALVMTQQPQQPRAPTTPAGSGGGNSGNRNRRHGRGGNGGNNGGNDGGNGGHNNIGNKGAGSPGPRPGASYLGFGNPWSGSLQLWPYGFGGLPGHPPRSPFDQPQQALHMMSYQGGYFQTPPPSFGYVGGPLPSTPSASSSTGTPQNAP
jgi:hypothetical protein